MDHFVVSMRMLGLATQIEELATYRAGMVAENQVRETKGEAVAYDDKSFDKLAHGFQELRKKISELESEYVGVNKDESERISTDKPDVGCGHKSWRFLGYGGHGNLYQCTVCNCKVMRTNEQD